MPKGMPIAEMLKENITLSAGNTYTEVELSLLEEIGKQVKRGKNTVTKVMLIHEIWLEPVSGDNYPFDAAGVTDGDSWDIQFTTNSESAIVETIDKDLVFKYGEVINLLTSGLLMYPKVRKIKFTVPIPYIKKRLWVGAVSDGLAGTLDVNFTILHSYTYVSQFQLNRMIASKI